MFECEQIVKIKFYFINVECMGLRPKSEMHIFKYNKICIKKKIIIKIKKVLFILKKTIVKNHSKLLLAFSSLFIFAFSFSFSTSLLACFTKFSTVHSNFISSSSVVRNPDVASEIKCIMYIHIHINVFFVNK